MRLLDKELLENLMQGVLERVNGLLIQVLLEGLGHFSS